MVWHTWLGFFGLAFGIAGGSIIGWSLLRSALVGLACGIVVAVVINVVTAGAAPCLQSAKSWTILVAYKICQ